MQTYQTPTEAFIDGLWTIRRDGRQLSVRGSVVREVIQHGISIAEPRKRFILPRGRKGNPFSTVAETLWVLNGRDDVKFLDAYMPMAARCYSDDGEKWRAAYGPRLRRWPRPTSPDVDQIGEVVRLLRADPNTRRAAISLFDPASDFVESKDIPCNNWIHAIARNGELHLSVAVRSNDVWFGFSGINLFEWSVLQEALAYWTGNKVGKYSVLIGSLHLYEQHEKAASQVLEHWENRKTIYDFGIHPAKFDVPFENLDGNLKLWFELEEGARRGEWKQARSKAVALSPFLRDALSMSSIWYCSNCDDTGGVIDLLESMPETDFKAASAEWLVRHNKVSRGHAVFAGPIADYLASAFPHGGPA